MLSRPMKKCEQSCMDSTTCADTGECCHSCMYFVSGICNSMGAAVYFPSHFKRLIVGG